MPFSHEVKTYKKYDKALSVSCEDIVFCLSKKKTPDSTS